MMGFVHRMREQLWKKLGFMETLVMLVLTKKSKQANYKNQETNETIQTLIKETNY